MRLSYRFSLYAGFLIIVVLLILLAFVLFRVFLHKSTETEFFAQAERVARGITEEIDRRLESLLYLSRTYARDRQIVSSIREDRRNRLEARLKELYAYSNLDLLEVGDSGARVLARGHRPGAYGDSKSSQAIIRNALEDRASADLEYGASGIALRAVSPIASGSGRPLGTLMTGVLLNKDFFDIYKTITGFDIALYEDGSAIAGTYGSGTNGSPPVPSIAAGTNLQAEKVRFRINHKEMWGFRIPVHHLTGERFGSLLLWMDRDIILASLRVNRYTLSVTLLVAFVLVTLFALFLSRNFSLPLKRMLPIMDRVSHGELNVSMPVSRWKEFQELSRNFRSMLEKLEKSREMIEKTQQRLIVAGKLAVLGRVTAEFAHEVRNPLNSMEINLRLLKEELAEGPEPMPDIVDRLELVRSEIKRLKQTIRDFVQAGGRIALQKTPLRIANEAREVLALARPQIEAVGIRLCADLREGKAVPVDRNRFHQALLNIILNACQSMKPGGTLTIRSEETKGGSSIVVRDTGVGMTPEEREKLFDFPFTSKPDGTGCGLSYVLRIMQAHRGDFDIHSEPGAGTTVRLTFFRYAGGERK